MITWLSQPRLENLSFWKKKQSVFCFPYLSNTNMYSVLQRLRPVPTRHVQSTIGAYLVKGYAAGPQPRGAPLHGWPMPFRGSYTSSWLLPPANRHIMQKSRGYAGKAIRGFVLHSQAQLWLGGGLRGCGWALIRGLACANLSNSQFLALIFVFHCAVSGLYGAEELMGSPCVEENNYFHG